MSHDANRGTVSMKVTTAFNRAMRQSRREDGTVELSEAAARLAERLRWDDPLRAEIGAFVLAHLMEPYGSLSRELFQDVNGCSLEEHVQGHSPSVERLRELEDEEAFLDPVPPAYRKAMRGEEAPEG